MSERARRATRRGWWTGEERAAPVVDDMSERSHVSERAHDLIGAIRWEFARIAARPWTDALVVAMNALLVSALWIFLPGYLTNWAFALNGVVAFAVILEIWMLADTFVTNAFAGSRQQVLARIRSRSDLDRWLWARTVVIWCLVGPICGAVALGLGIANHRIGAAICACVVLLVMPFALVSLMSWVGILFPYHPRSLIWRWRHRRQWRLIARWLLLVAVPYYLMLILASVLLWPALLIASVAFDRDVAGHLPVSALVVETVITCLVVAGATLVGHRGAMALAIRRADRLIAYLSEPENG